MKDTQGIKSRFRGVYKCGKRWKAQLQSRGIQFYLGMFDSEEDAARAYDVKAREENGVKSLTNFDSLGNENILLSVGPPQSSYSSDESDDESDNNEDNFIYTVNGSNFYDTTYNHGSISNSQNLSHSMKSGIDSFKNDSDTLIHQYPSKVNDSMYQLNYNTGILWERFILISQRLLLAKATQIRLNELQILSPDTEKESILSSLNDEIILLNIAKSQLEEAVSKVFMLGLDTNINNSQINALSHYNESLFNQDLNEDSISGTNNVVVNLGYKSSEVIQQQLSHSSNSFITVDNDSFGRRNTHLNEGSNNESSLLTTAINNKNCSIVNNTFNQMNNLQNSNLNDMMCEPNYNYLIPNSVVNMNEAVDLTQQTSYTNKFNGEMVDQYILHDNNNTNIVDYNWLSNSTGKDIALNAKRNFLYTDLLKPYSAVRNPAFIRAAAISNTQSQYPALNPTNDYNTLPQYGYDQTNYASYGNYNPTVLPNQMEFRDYNNYNSKSNVPAVNTDKGINISSTISTDAEAKSYGLKRSYANSYKRSKTSSSGVATKKLSSGYNNNNSYHNNNNSNNNNNNSSSNYNVPSVSFNTSKNTNSERHHERHHHTQNIDMISKLDKAIALHNREADSKINQKQIFKETLKEFNSL